MGELVVAAVVAALVSIAVRTAVDWLMNAFGLYTLSEAERFAAAEKATDISVLSEHDLHMTKETAACVARVFGEPLCDAVRAMSAEARLSASNELITELCSLYGVAIDKIEYGELDSGNSGSYDAKECVVKLDVRYLMSQNEACIREYFNILLHEMRHVVQLSVLLDENQNWQVSEETMLSWFNNFSDYTKPEQDRKGYREQPIEVDARTFAHVALKGVA